MLPSKHQLHSLPASQTSSAYCFHWIFHAAGELEALNEAAAPLPPLLAPEKAQFPKFDVGTGLVMFDS